MVQMSAALDSKKRLIKTSKTGLTEGCSTIVLVFVNLLKQIASIISYPEFSFNKRATWASMRSSVGDDKFDESKTRDSFFWSSERLATEETVKRNSSGARLHKACKPLVTAVMEYKI
eukprot:Lithocolla_globosa_v1_NODE_682_length_3441_cov_30.890068.p2 type:complete len:117 gc:universal NODE_682_length_3441_cov_30.890068:2186-2536(+)